MIDICNKLFELVYLISLIIFTPLLILLLHNIYVFIYWTINKSFFPTNTGYENKKIIKYQKAIVPNGIFLIVIIFNIIIATRPVKLIETIGIQNLNEIQIVRIITRESKLPKEINLNNNETEELISLFNKYKYKRAFFSGPSRRLGIQDIRIEVITTEPISELVNVWDWGYIEVSGEGTYKLISPNNDNLFIDIMEFLKDK